ncbi:MAG: hypothetical protein LQ347_003466 [Umbilicaria vellea]|nr:MAG: hypothetical protein LQ347_003466 [Umbilicaria vellea]
MQIRAGRGLPHVLRSRPWDPTKRSSSQDACRGYTNIQAAASPARAHKAQVPFTMFINSFGKYLLTVSETSMARRRISQQCRKIRVSRSPVPLPTETVRAGGRGKIAANVNSRSADKELQQSATCIGSLESSGNLFMGEE